MRKIFSYLEQNNLFVNLLVLFLAFWFLMSLLVPAAHAAPLSELPSNLSYFPADSVDSEYVLIFTDETGLHWLYRFYDSVTLKKVTKSGSNYIQASPSTFDSYSGTADTGWTLVNRGYTYNEYTNISTSKSGVVVYCTVDIINSIGGTVYYSADVYDPAAGVPPVNPDDGTEEDTEESPGWFGGLIDSIGGFFDDLLSGIGNFFADLLEPIISLFEAIWRFFASAVSLGDLWSKLEQYTLEPIVNFFDSLSNGVIVAFSQIWDFPIIKELVLAVVAVLVIGGIMLLFVSL